MATNHHTAASLIRKSSPTTKAIQGVEIPPTLAFALKEGFSRNGHEAGTVSVRGNVETLKGTATFEQNGLDWLSCPVVVTMKYDWAKLRATRKTAELVL